MEDQSMDGQGTVVPAATGTALVEPAEHNDSSSSSAMQITDPTAVIAAMQRRGRHRKSDAAIDAAIFSMLLTGRHLTAMTVHRELLKNPRYNLSERTVRRRMNEFFEFQRANNLTHPPDRQPTDADIPQDGKSGNGAVWSGLNAEGAEGGGGCCGDTCDSPISSLQKLFAFTETAAASSDLFNTEFDNSSLSPSVPTANEESGKAKQFAASFLEGRLVKGEGEGEGVRSVEELFSMTAPSQSLLRTDPTPRRRRPHPDSLTDTRPPPQHHGLADSSSESSSRRRNASYEGTDALSGLQGENQAELVDEGRSDGGEELRERLEAEFASLSHEALDEFMREVEVAVQQHRKQMAARAALLINELPPAKKRQLLDKLKPPNHSP